MGFDVRGNKILEAKSENILYLSPHSQDKEYAEVHDQDRPVNRDVEHLRE